MLKIFISYRRRDMVASALLRSIDARLVEEFGRDSVFVDIDSIPLGIDFLKYTFDSVAQCNVFLALIGDQWLSLLREREGDENDFVQLEIEAAFKTGIPVVPILMGGAQMPPAADLPLSIRPLAYRNAMVLDHGRDFNNHMRRLITELEVLDRRHWALATAGRFDGSHRISLAAQTYDLLESELKAGRWKSADYLTGRMMLALTQREDYGWLDSDSVRSADKAAIKKIDDLWISHSGGRFGYAVQAQLYEELGGTAAYDSHVWQAFADKVGWRIDGEWTLYNDMMFSLDAPAGHLPDGFVAVQMEDRNIVRCWVPALL